MDDMTPIFHKLPGHTISVWCVADVHIGSAECDIEGFASFLERVVKAKHDYVVICGDLVDNATKVSRTNIYEEVCTPQEQIDEAVRLLRPLADAGRILAVVRGNHEQRTVEGSGIDPMLEICARLGISKAYRPNMAFVRVKLEKNGVDDVYNLLVTHGRSAGAKKRFAYSLEGVDAVITGHTHDPMVDRPARLVFTRAGNVKVKSLVSVTATSWLGYGGYSAANMYLPKATSRPQCLVLEFSGTNRREGRITVVW